MNNLRIKVILIAIPIVLLWNISAWLIAKHFYIARVTEVVEQQTKLSNESAGDLADSIGRNLNYLHGISDMLSKLVSVKNVTSQFGYDINPSTLPIEDRKKRWAESPKLNDLSQYLALAKDSLNVDIIYVVNAAGDCIAASNWNTHSSSIGTNFIDRDYFQTNKDGLSGMQYAIGKTTHIPGLYFSTPVFIDGHFMGAVVVKTDVPNLSFLVKELDAFLTDENGVIVLAHNKWLEMRALQGAIVAGMTEQQSFARYRRSEFPVLKIDSWGDKEFPSLMRVQDESLPHVFATHDIPGYRMEVYVAGEIDTLGTITHDMYWFIFLLGMSGSILILIAAGAVLYGASIKATELALGRANLAERRIIGLSEDIQQRIGQELHDDLGQLLTGIAFMSQVLFKRLESQGSAEARDASRVTKLIDEAISKTRNLAQGLYPVELKEAGLPAMLNNLARNTEAIYSIECEFICEVDYRIEDQIFAINLFRIAQEAVNNAVKHGDPTRIILRLVSEATAINLEISDNGFGIRHTAGPDHKEGLGMHSMQYRASLLGGTIHIGALSSGGTSVVVIIPV